MLPKIIALNREQVVSFRRAIDNVKLPDSNSSRYLGRPAPTPKQGGRGCTADQAASANASFCGSSPTNVRHDVAELAKLAKLMKPRRRRQLTAKQRAKRAAHLAQVRPQSLTHDAGEARISTQTGPADGQVDGPHSVLFPLPTADESGTTAAAAAPLTEVLL
jgi:hypothetical protein